MASNNSGEIRIKDPIDSILGIESHLFSTRTADLYRGFDLSDGTALSFWLLRGKLSSIHRDLFISRLANIEQLQLPNCPMKGYGVDSVGRGFAIFPAFDASPIVSGSSSNLDGREAERRFTPCLQTLDKLHKFGIVLGDLCSSSFILDRSGRILFIGVIGDIGVEPASSSMNSSKIAAIDGGGVTTEILQYLAPEQREVWSKKNNNEAADLKSGSPLAQACDVYAIGILGYRLFGGKFPFPNLTLSQLSDPLFVYPAITPLNPKSTTIPSWCNEIFTKCLHVKPDVRYANASEIQLEIQALRQKKLFQSEAPVVIGRPVSSANAKINDSQEGAEIFQSLSKKERVKSQDAALRFKVLIILLVSSAVLVSVIVGVITYFNKPIAVSPQIVDLEENNDVIDDLMTLKKATSETKLRDAIEIISHKNSSLEDRAVKLKDLVASNDNIAQEVLITAAVQTPEKEFRNLVQNAIIARVRRLGGNHISEQLTQYLRTVPAGPLPEGYEAMLKVANPQQAVATREALLRQVYPRNSQYILRYAAAMVLDAKNPQEYRLVIAQLFGDALNISDATKRSTFALLLAYPDVSTLFSDEILDHKSDIPDSDLNWLLGILAAQNDSRVRQLAELTLERGQASPLRQIFLNAIKGRGDLSPDVLISLVRAGSGTVTSADISQFGSWVDESSEKVLLALCIDVKDQKLIGEAFETLAAKTLTLTPALGLMEIIHSKYWDQRSELAPLVAIASLPNVVPENVIHNQIEKLIPYTKDSNLIDLFASSEDRVLSQAIIDRFSESLGIGALLKLLSNNDKQLRIKAILALKRYNEIGALKLILSQYDKEKDPDVLKVYKDSFWMIAERELKRN